MRLRAAALLQLNVPRRAQAVCAALLLVAAQGSNAAHLLIAPHEVCPEHGELVHADGRDGGHGVTAEHRSEQDAQAPTHGPAVGAAHDGALDEHGDDHCPVLSSRREHAIVGSAGACLSAALAVAGDAPAADAAIRGEPRARYDVAPKQSPPV